MGDVVELVVTKGKTVKAPDREEWFRVEYSVKATVSCTEESHIAKAQLDAIVDAWLAEALQGKGKAAAPQSHAGSDPAQLFPEDLRNLLSFEQTADVVIIKPKQFLGTENFAKIADVVKQHGGEWVSAGKNSHFKIPPRNVSHDSTA